MSLKCAINLRKMISIFILLVSNRLCENILSMTGMLSYLCPLLAPAPPPAPPQQSEHQQHVHRQPHHRRLTASPPHHNAGVCHKSSVGVKSGFLSNPPNWEAVHRSSWGNSAHFVSFAADLCRVVTRACRRRRRREYSEKENFPYNSSSTLVYSWRERGFKRGLEGEPLAFNIFLSSCAKFDGEIVFTNVYIMFSPAKWANTNTFLHIKEEKKNICDEDKDYWLTKTDIYYRYQRD